MEKIIYLPTFLTATIKDWKPLLKPDKYKIIIQQKLKQLVDDNKIILYAYCIMDNHIHLIWQIKGDVETSKIQKDYLESTAKKIKADLEIHHPQILKLFVSTQKDRDYHFWKRRPLPIDLYTPAVFEQKVVRRGGIYTTTLLQQTYVNYRNNIRFLVHNIIMMELMSGKC